MNPVPNEKKLAIGFGVFMVLSIFTWIFGIFTAAIVPWFSGLRAEIIGLIGMGIAGFGECGANFFGWLNQRFSKKEKAPYESARTEPKLIFRAVGAFLIEGRGVCISPGQRGAGRAQVGNTIELRRPDGSSLLTTVRAITYPHGDILLSEKFAKIDIPIGTEVWTVGV